VHGESSVAGLPTEPFLLDQAVQQIPEQEFDLICEELLEQLDPSCRDVVLLKLAGHTNDEISRQIACSLSTIERKLRLVRRIWDEHSKA
jgi:DNA-directed RNA polymerase specialized sigma24 family protein